MLKVLFQLIPSILFEPIAVGAVLGFVIGAVLCWRKKTAWYWSVAFSLIFMLSWRLAIQIASSRYASILVFPATIATAYFAFKMDWLAGFIPKFPELLRKSLPYLAVVGIAIGGVAQLMHYNPYADRILKIAELIKQDSEQFKGYRIAIDGDRRIAYYTGLNRSEIKSRRSPVKDKDFFKKTALRFKLGPACATDIAYVVFSDSAKNSADVALRDVPNFIQHELKLLGEFYHNRKKRQVTRVFRYNLKKAFNLSVFPAGLDCPSEKPIKTYSFTKSYPANSVFYQKQIRYFSKLGKGYQAPVLIDFPVNWFAQGTGGYYAGSNGELGIVLTTNKNRVFRMESDLLIVATCLSSVAAATYQVRIIASGAPGSVFAFGMRYYATSHLVTEPLPCVQIPDAGVWEFWLTQRDMPTNARRMFPMLHLYHGEIFVHSIELYEVDDKK